MASKHHQKGSRGHKPVQPLPRKAGFLGKFVQAVKRVKWGRVWRWANPMITIISLIFGTLGTYGTYQQVQQGRVSSDHRLVVRIGAERLQPDDGRMNWVLGVPFPAGDNANLATVPIILTNEGERTVRNVNLVIRLPKLIQPIDLPQYTEQRVVALAADPDQVKFHREELDQFTYFSYTIDALNPGQSSNIGMAFVLNEDTQIRDTFETADGSLVTYQLDLGYDGSLQVSAEDIKSVHYPFTLSAVESTDLIDLAKKVLPPLREEQVRKAGGWLQAELWGNKAEAIIGFTEPRLVSALEKGSVFEIQFPASNFSRIGFSAASPWEILLFLTFLAILVITLTMAVRSISRRWRLRRKAA